jgi:hypothetical protein
VFGAFDVCCSVFHGCPFFVRGCNGACSLCLLLNSYAYWSWRRATFVGERGVCYRGLAVEHVILVVEFIEGVIGRVVDDGIKAVEEEEQADGRDQISDAMGDRSGCRAGARRTQPPADGIDTRNTPSSGLSAGFILASAPLYLLGVQMLTIFKSRIRSMSRWTISSGVLFAATSRTTRVLRTRWNKHLVIIWGFQRLVVLLSTDDSSFWTHRLLRSCRPG